jgi:hypothetical protein
MIVGLVYSTRLPMIGLHPILPLPEKLRVPLKLSGG